MRGQGECAAHQVCHGLDCSGLVGRELGAKRGAASQEEGGVAVPGARRWSEAGEAGAGVVAWGSCAQRSQRPPSGAPASTRIQVAHRAQACRLGPEDSAERGEENREKDPMGEAIGRSPLANEAPVRRKQPWGPFGFARSNEWPDGEGLLGGARLGVAFVPAPSRKESWRLAQKNTSRHATGRSLMGCVRDEP